MTSFASAAPSTTKVVNFQGRLQTASGAVVPDGYYNIQFKIYQGGSGSAAGNPDGTLNWSESYVNDSSQSGIEVKNGLFSVSLGSINSFNDSVDWDSDTLWLSMNVAGSDPACSTFGSTPCQPDGEMLPMKQITAAPYAIAAGSIGGKTADDLVQLGQGTQEDASANASISINKTGAGDLIQLQSGATDIFTVGSAGDITLGSNSAKTISVSASTGGPGQSLTLAAGRATVGDNAGGDLVLQAGSGSGAGADGDIIMDDNVTVGPGNTITMVGGATALRPASPTEGMVYFDSETNQLLVYNGTKWAGDSKASTLVVAASDSIQSVKDGADFTADDEAVIGTGTIDGDQIQINAAINALPASGGSVYLAAGTYYLDDSIVLPSNVTLTGAGNSSLITVNTGVDSSVVMAINSDRSAGNTGIKINNLKFSGNYTNVNGSNVIRAIDMRQVGTAALNGVSITDIYFDDFRGSNIRLDVTTNSVIQTNTFTNGGDHGLNITDSTDLRISNNNFQNMNGSLYLGNIDGSILSNNQIISDSANTSDLPAFNLHSSSNYNRITANSFRLNSGIALSTSNARHNLIANNSFIANGGDSSFSTIDIGSTSSDNTLSDNLIRDNGGSGYAISISSMADRNNLSNNSFSGTGAEEINDSSSSTIYMNQRDASGTLINRSEGGFSVQTSAGSDAMTVDADTGDIGVVGTLEAGSLRASSLDAASAGSLTIAANNATSVSIGTSDTTGTTLVLDTKTDAGDPTGTNGAMYYNADAGKFRCYQAGSWQDCITPLPVYKAAESNTEISGFAVDINDMVFNLAANTKYHYKFVIKHTAPDGAGFGVTTPTGSTGTNWCTNVTLESASAVSGPSSTAYCGTGDASTVISDTEMPGNGFVSVMEGYVETSSTVGDLRLRGLSGSLTGFSEVSSGSFGIVQIVQ